MQKCVSDYLDGVCAAIRKKALHPMVRAELADHITERCAGLEREGMEPEAAAREAVLRMGDPSVLGRRIAAANRTKVNAATVIGGLASAVATLWVMILWGGGEVALFFDPPSFIGVIGLSVAYGLLSCGGKPALLPMLRGIRKSAIPSGIIIALIGIIIMMGNLGDPAAMGGGTACALIAPLYSLIIYTGVRAAENWFTAPQPGSIRELVE